MVGHDHPASKQISMESNMSISGVLSSGSCCPPLKPSEGTSSELGPFGPLASDHGTCCQDSCRDKGLHVEWC